MPGQLWPSADCLFQFELSNGLGHGVPLCLSCKYQCSMQSYVNFQTSCLTFEHLLWISKILGTGVLSDSAFKCTIPRETSPFLLDRLVGYTCHHRFLPISIPVTFTSLPKEPCRIYRISTKIHGPCATPPCHRAICHVVDITDLPKPKSFHQLPRTNQIHVAALWNTAVIFPYPRGSQYASNNIKQIYETLNDIWYWSPCTLPSLWKFFDRS